MAFLRGLRSFGKSYVINTKAFLSLITFRPRVPRDSVAITYGRPFRYMLWIAIPGDAFFFFVIWLITRHLVVAPYIAAVEIVADFWVIGLACLLTITPHAVGPSGLLLRRAELPLVVPIDAIESVKWRRYDRTSDEEQAKGVLVIAFGTDTQVVVKLRGPTRIDGVDREITEVRFSADSNTAIAAIQEVLDARRLTAMQALPQ